MPMQLGQLGGLNDYSLEEAQIERRRKYAEMLQQQAGQPLDPSQSVGGWAIPISPFAGLAKMLQGYSAGKANSNLDAREKALADLLKTLDSRIAEVRDSVQ